MANEPPKEKVPPAARKWTAADMKPFHRPLKGDEARELLESISPSRPECGGHVEGEEGFVPGQRHCTPK